MITRRKASVEAMLERLARTRLPAPATPLAGGPPGPEGPSGGTGPEGPEGKEGKEGPAGKDGGGSLIGEVKDWAGVGLPVVEGQEYRWADGSAVSRAAYAALFARMAISTTGNRTSGAKAIKAIPSTTNMKVGMPVSGTGIQAGTTIEVVNSANEITLSKTATSTGSGGAVVVAPFGVGDGATTFNLPDFRGRGGVAPDDMGGTDAGRVSTVPQQLGGSGGTERHTLSESEMPSHSHGPGEGGTIIVGSGTNPYNLAFGSPATTFGSKTGNTGGGQPHNNMPPFLNVNRIIRVA